MDFEFIKNAMADLDEDALLDSIKAVADNGGDEASKVISAMQEGMQSVGARYEEGEYFVGDLIYAGEIMSEAMEIIKPFIKSSSGSSMGKMLLCTVKDDMHDIGKNIVRAMLEAAGFEVFDLGVDVPADKIVSAVKENGISIVALSGILTLALDSMKATIEAFKAEGLRDSVKIIIGGAPVNDHACAACGADEWAHSPQKTVDICKQWAESFAQ